MPKVSKKKPSDAEVNPKLEVKKGTHLMKGKPMKNSFMKKMGKKK